MKSEKKPFHETVAEKLIEQLHKGTAPWQKPWKPGEAGSNLPINPITGKRYKGINAIQLMSEAQEDQRWMTYKQARSVDAQVRKDEKGTQIQYWKFSEERNKTDAVGKPVVDGKGDPVKEIVQLERPRVFFATVFNATQIDNLPPLPLKVQTWNSVARAEQILQGSGATIHHGAQDRAFYRSKTDCIHLPGKDQFPTAENYYATALHELGHWTGHETRLARDLVHPFGSEGYAKEELRAEIASMIMGDELGIGHDPEQHAAYVGSWIRALENDPLEIFRAAADAEKIQEYLMGMEQKNEQELTVAEALNVKIEQILPYSDTASLDAHVISARRGLLAGNASGGEHAMSTEEFARTSERVLGFALPVDWNGRVRVEGYGTETVDGEEVFTTILPKDAEPEGWGVFAQHVDGGFAMMASFSNERAADRLAERLAIIDAHSTMNEHEKSAKLARVNEERVRRDPASTSQDIAAAREARKDAEFAAATNDRDLQWRIGLEERETTARPSGAADTSTTPKILIDVPYKQKEDAKALGAKWDRQQQSWYIPPGVDFSPFAKWAREAAKAAVGEAQVARVAIDTQPKNELTHDRQYLVVPYSMRETAKAAGAKWDKTAKSWYAGPKADMATLRKWSPENVELQQGPAVSPREEFAEALESVGCILSGEHPIMDGKKHRITVEGEKFSQNAGSGFYVSHLDGHPAGYIKNNKTGVERTWKSKGYVFDRQQKAMLAADAIEKLRQREVERSKQQEQAATRVSKQMERLVPALQPTTYMQLKGIAPQTGAYTDKDGRKTYLPAMDVDGKQWTMQYIQEDGTKRFAKDSRKEGCFHVVGGFDDLAKAPALIIGEGYATAVQLKQALGFATVSAFDSGNLLVVAQALHQKFPDKPIVIAGDDDRHLEMAVGANPGRTNAEEAAKLVGGRVLLPIFAPDEGDYPDGLAPVTPNKYSAHQKNGTVLSDEQVSAISWMKQFTDFNDLAIRSVLGEEGVNRQVRSVVDDVIEKHGLTSVAQQHEREQKQVQEVTQPIKPNRYPTSKIA